MIRALLAARTWLVVGALALAGACGGSTVKTGAGGAAAGTAAAGGDMGAVLAAHNRYRAQHCAPPLSWSNAIARKAQAWAQNCKFVHSRNGLGENIAWGTAGAFSPVKFAEKWYGEVANYDFASGRSRNGGEILHFTQVVWANSTQLGCGWARCGGSDFLVCNYSPPGNYQGRHRGNVRPRC